MTAQTGQAPAERLPVSLRHALVSALGLSAFTLAFTALMAFTYEATRERIAAAAEAQQMRLIDEILPRGQYDNALLKDAVTAAPGARVGRIWRARRANAPAALIFETFAGDGYGGRIELIASLGIDGKTGGARVVSHKETPGLGDYIDPARDRDKNAPWIGQFVGVDAPLPPARWDVKKDGGAFDQRTGATVSARAVTRALGQGFAWVATRREAIFSAPADTVIGADAQVEQTHRQ
ncbi:MAG: RnfABCDGE type electron transport complex subunit G [Azoarcus sp.]|jgi:electron transport complex protein RnfG|nr:RnfABCDGE type electron transport complex subunit G [Azoarcus sp.]